MQHMIFDTEIIGTKRPKFLICCKCVETKRKHFFWMHKPGDMKKFERLLPNYTWVGFNSENFDRPVIAAALMGYDEHGLKVLAEHIIREEMRSWATYREFKLDFLDYDHIDLIDVAPGVMTSLKTYAGRMNFKTMIDMPFDHTHDLKPAELATVEQYCLNDVEVTEALFNELSERMALRERLSAEYDLDLRSKSDAQIAEAILKSKCGISKRENRPPSSVGYTTPSFIKTSNPKIQEIIKLVNNHQFQINFANGSPEVPEFLKEPLALGKGLYQLGIGGLHSLHDQQMYLEASETLMLSDFDVASYYPNIMMKAGLIPNLGGNKGAKFIEEYRKIYEARMEAKRAGDKVVANSLKITLNGTFGKLGNIYCSFYSPDLLLAVTITGQLNLLCLIDELEKIKSVYIKSANTDGILVAYPPGARERVLQIFARNTKRTGFEYEETPYIKYAAKDVNNYIAVKPDGKTKRKGLYAIAGVEEMKNPTMEVSSNAAANFLTTGELPESYIKHANRIEDFVAIRNVKGGGVQHLKTKLVDDWMEISDRLWSYPGMRTKPVKRKSRPPAREVGVGGKSFGRVARWYMTTETLPPLSYISSGNTVPKTEGGKVCMTLPSKLPKDLNKQWYIDEAYKILSDCGVQL